MTSSESISPTLRVGYLAAPPELAPRLARLKALSALGVRIDHIDLRRHPWLRNVRYMLETPDGEVWLFTFSSIVRLSAALAACWGRPSGAVSMAPGSWLAWGAAVLAKRAPTGRRTYGLRKGTILASLTNAALLLVAVGAIAWEAVRRFADPHDDRFEGVGYGVSRNGGILLDGALAKADSSEYSAGVRGTCVPASSNRASRRSVLRDTRLSNEPQSARDTCPSNAETWK